MQGFNNNPLWVEAFKVSYSTDGHVWSTIKEKDQPIDRIFVGNFDSGTVLTQYFENLIFARYLKIHPTKWHQSIGLRLEIIGCYEAQSTVSYPTTTTRTPDSSLCAVCPGLSGASLNNSSCECPADLKWDGSECVEESLCPCYHNSIRSVSSSSHLSLLSPSEYSRARSSRTLTVRTVSAWAEERWSVSPRNVRPVLATSSPSSTSTASVFARSVTQNNSSARPPKSALLRRMCAMG